MADHSEAKRLLDAGYKLVHLHEYSKAPLGDRWNAPENYVTKIEKKATGYGLPLVANGLCSIDPDHVEFARKGLHACGFDLDELLAAGVKTESTRPGSGGRSAFVDPGDLIWRTFTVKFNGVDVTALEMRAHSPNLQDTVPGIEYKQRGDETGNVYTQRYANGRTYLNRMPLPERFHKWWKRCSEDNDFWQQQVRLFAAACGALPVVQHCTGKNLPFKSGCRNEFNKAHTVAEILEEHGYIGGNGRYMPPSATGSPGVRKIPDKDDLWQSDHASDPLRGTFDAWSAYVILSHNSNSFEAAEQWMKDAAEKKHEGFKLDGFKPNLLRVAPPPVEYAVDGLLQVGKAGLLAAEGATGKTTFLGALGIHAVLGRDFMGRKVKRGPFVLISRDDDQDDLDALVQELSLTMKLSDSECAVIERDLHIVSLRGTQHSMLIQPEDNAGRRWMPSDFVPHLMREIERVRPVMVAVDTVRQFTGVETTNESAQIVFMSVLNDIASRGCTTIGAHHVGKQAAREKIVDMYSAIGSSALADNSRFVLRLIKLQPEEYTGPKAVIDLPLDAVIPAGADLLQLHSTRGSLRVKSPEPTLYTREVFRLTHLAGQAKRISPDEQKRRTVSKSVESLADIFSRLGMRVGRPEARRAGWKGDDAKFKEIADAAELLWEERRMLD